MNKFSKLKVHWQSYNHCLFVVYLASVTFGYGWISDTKFNKFSDKDWIWICKNFFGYGSGVEKSISAHLRYYLTALDHSDFCQSQTVPDHGDTMRNGASRSVSNLLYSCHHKRIDRV